MEHSHLRVLAMTGKADELMQWAEALMAQDPSRKYARDSLEIVSTLVKGEFVAADALMESALYRYEKSPAFDYINQISCNFGSYIDFAAGRFGEVKRKARLALDLNPEVEKIQAIDRLALLKILADTHFLLDEFDELEKIAAEAEAIDIDGDRDQAIYYLNTIRALNLMHQGEFKSALAMAEQAIEIGRINGFVGLAHNLTVTNLQLRCLVAMAKLDEARSIAEELKASALELKNWPWYLVTNGFTIKNLAQNNQMAKALSLVRHERELISSFSFKNELDMFADASELYVRFLLGDSERIQVLMQRLPDLLVVQQIRSYQESSRTPEGLDSVKSLPEKNSREKLYKLVAFVDYFHDQESKALPYAREAIALAEVSGYIQFLFLQPEIHHLFLKAAKIKPTAYSEDFARRLTTLMKERELLGRGEMMDPLTSRELEVVQHLATGKPISAIAGTLHVSMNTMKTHLRNAYRKLGVDGRDSAVEKAKELLII